MYDAHMKQCNTKYLYSLALKIYVIIKNNENRVINSLSVASHNDLSLKEYIIDNVKQTIHKHT